MASYIVFAVVSTMLTTSVLCQDIGCPLGYTNFGSSCYAFVDQNNKWVDAQATCNALGGFLAEIYTDDENNFIQKMAKDHHADAIWLGGEDLLQEGKWAWAKSGVEISEYSDWASGQPDDGGDENCMEMNVDKYGSHWNDDQCDHKQPFICQRLLGDTFIGR